MRHDYSSSDNKHPKVHFNEYLASASEPRDDGTHYVSPRLTAQLLGEDDREGGHGLRRYAQAVSHYFRTH